MLKKVTTLFLLSQLASCALFGSDLECPIPGGERVDSLIQDDEAHFTALWKLTSGGENAEGYWSFAGDRLSFQRRNEAERINCDRIFTTDAAAKDGAVGWTQLSGGAGATTCAHFMPGDKEVIFASTHMMMDSCPPPPDQTKGYVWSLHPEYDLYVRPVDWVDEMNGIDDEVWPERRLTDTWGYDAEATVSPTGNRIVFTSTRSGDLELWTCDLDGRDLKQVTNEVGYDGGAFFSHDGTQLVYRRTEFPREPAERASAQAAYTELLKENLVRPSAMEIHIVNADGTDNRQVTALGGANFAPFFFPGDQRIIFSTNFASASGRDFDLYAVGADGTNVERITTYEGFDSFPMFSPDGKWLVFASNRGGATMGETNLFVARWE